MEKQREKEKFVKVVPSKTISHINDIYYGTKGLHQKGHIVASGSVVVEEPSIVGETLENVYVEQPLYHRNAEGEVLFDTKIKR